MRDMEATEVEEDIKHGASRWMKILAATLNTYGKHSRMTAT